MLALRLLVALLLTAPGALAQSANGYVPVQAPLAPVTIVGGLPPSAAADASIPLQITTGSILVAKASPGNLYGFSVTAGAASGFLALLNVTAAPPAGAAIAPVECVPLAAGAYFARRQILPDRYTVGLVAVMSSSCTTYTAVTPTLISLSVL